MKKNKLHRVESRRAVIYTRVSTKEQAENYSLDNQTTACERFAVQHSYEAIRVFKNTHGESAKTVDRKALGELLEFVTNKANKIGAIIVWKHDRLSRNMVDFSALHETFRKLGIKVLSATEPNSDGSAGRLLRNMTGAFAQYENDVKSERTIAGMQRAVEEGRWVWHQPVGYAFRKDELGKAKLYPDDNAQFIRTAFELTAIGSYSQAEILQKLRANGFTGIYKQKLCQILRNPIYAGWISKPDWFPERVRGIHEPLVDDATWGRAQLVLDGKRPNTAPMLRNNPEFPLRKFVSCQKCGRPVTGSFSTSRNKSVHPYYHCPNSTCGFGSVRRQDLHDKFAHKLDRLRVAPTLLNLFGAIIRDCWTDYVGSEVAKQQQLEKRRIALEGERTKLTRLFAAEKLNETTYLGTIQKIESEFSDVLVSQSEINPNHGRIEECVVASQRLLVDPAGYWQGADLRAKQRFQKFIFPEGLAFYAGEFGTAPTSIVFKLLGGSKVESSNMAPPAGLEPATR